MICSFQQSGLPIAALYDAMLDAFSDYVVPMQPTLEAFETMMRSRGFDADASQVALSDGKITASWNVGIRGNAAYLITSGTRPGHRGQGLSKQLGLNALLTLRQAGCTHMTTEVIDGNASAQRLYEKLGFRVQRRLDCYRLAQADGPEAVLDDWSAAKPVLARLETHKPSWQNQDVTLGRINPAAVIAPDGVAVFDPQSGIVFRVAGNLLTLLPQMRRYGDLRFINLDATDHAMAEQLREAELFLSQNELFLSLQETKT